MDFWVIDFKTGREKELSPTSLKKGDGLQIALYMLALRARGGRREADRRRARRAAGRRWHRSSHDRDIEKTYCYRVRPYTPGYRGGDTRYRKDEPYRRYFELK